MCVCVRELGDRRGGEILRLTLSADDARCQRALSICNLEYVSGTTTQTVQFKPTARQGPSSRLGKEETDLLRSADSSKLLTQPGLLRVHCGGQQENREWGRYPSHALVRSEGGLGEIHEGHQCQKLRTYQGCACPADTTIQTQHFSVGLGSLNLSNNHY